MSALDLTGRLYNLAMSLETRYDRFGALPDLDRAIELGSPQLRPLQTTRRPNPGG